MIHFIINSDKSIRIIKSLTNLVRYLRNLNSFWKIKYTVIESSIKEMNEPYLYHFGNYSYSYDYIGKYHHATKYEYPLPKRTQPPVYLQVMITNYCNLKCSYCYANSSPQGSTKWNSESMYEILMSAHHAGLSSVVFGGGEPLSVPWFIDLILKLKHNSTLEIAITTNGTLLTPNIVEILDQNEVSIRISINTMQEYYQRKRGLDMLLSQGMAFGINSMLSSDNNDLFDYIIPDILKNKRVNILLLESQSIGRGGLSPMSTEEIFQRIIQLRRRIGEGFDSIMVSGKLEKIFGNRPNIWRYPPELVNKKGFMGSLSSNKILRHTSFCPSSCGRKIVTNPNSDFLDVWEKVLSQSCPNYDLVIL